VFTRAVIGIAHECTLAARRWRRQLSWPFCAEHIKAVKPLFGAACTLACALRHDRPSDPPPNRMPLDTAPAPNTITHA